MEIDGWRRVLESGDTRRVKELLHNQTLQSSTSLFIHAQALEIAASYGHGDALDILLDAAPHDVDTLSLLRLAGFHGHGDAMWRLFQRLSIEERVRRGWNRHELETTLQTDCKKMLHAARQGDVATVHLMLQRDPVYAHCMDMETGETAFSVAFACGRRNVCEQLLSSGAFPIGVYVNYLQTHPATATIKHVKGFSVFVKASLVRRAVEEWNAPLVHWLLENGANSYTPAIDGNQSALALAAHNGAIEIVEILLGHGSRLEEAQCRWMPLPALWLLGNWTLTGHGRSSIPDSTSFLLLAIASYTQNRQFAHYLWATRSDLQDREQMAEYGTLALALAIHRRRDDMVQDLVAHGASVSASLVRSAIMETDAVGWLERFRSDTSDPPGRVAEQLLFVRAAQLGSIQCVIEMIQSGVIQSIETPRNSGACALRAFEYTIQNGNVEGARLLMETLDVPLSVASITRCFEYATTQQNLELLEILLTHPAATPNIVQEAFKDACLRGLNEAAAMLLAFGVDVNMSVCTGTTFLLHQVLSKVGQGEGHARTAKLLIEAGANINLLDSFNETPVVVIERRRSYIRTSIGMAQVESVEHVLQQRGVFCSQQSCGSAQ